jgi:hypothetical protein
MLEVLKLAPRPPQRPYLLWVQKLSLTSKRLNRLNVDLLAKQYLTIAARGDIVFIGMADESIPPSSGVTISNRGEMILRVEQLALLFRYVGAWLHCQGRTGKAANVVIHQNPYKSLRLSNEKCVDTPSYFLYHGNGLGMDYDFMNVPWLSNFRKVVTRQPCRTLDQEVADLVLVCCYVDSGKRTADGLLRLPARSPQRPYLIWTMRPKPAKTHQEVLSRKDMIFFSFDLRFWAGDDDDAIPMPGVTVATESMFKRPYDPDIQPRYFMTFRGSENNRMHMQNWELRTVVKNTFKSFNEDNLHSDVKVCVAETCNGFPDFQDLLNTSYGLILAGHGRWSMRLTETVQACAIPVVMADGLTLPYSELINWTSMLFIRSERLATNASALISSLPRDPALIRTMRRRVCQASKFYFETYEKRFTATLRSALLWTQRHGNARRALDSLTAHNHT